MSKPKSSTTSLPLPEEASIIVEKHSSFLSSTAYLPLIHHGKRPNASHLSGPISEGEPL